MILRSIYRYPVKGFSPDALSEVSLRASHVLPYDRHWSLAFGGNDAAINPANPESWVGKRTLLSLAREPKGAKLRTEFDEDGCRLILRQGDKVVCEGALNKPEDCRTIEVFLNDFYADTAFGDFRILRSVGGAVGGDKAGGGGGFTDFGSSHISLINLNTVKDIARVVGAEVEPLRFRGNLYFEAEAWAERDWAGKHLRIGTAEFQCTEEIERCRATSVSLESGEEDLNMPQTLRRNFGHMLCGMYAQATRDGAVNIGDKIDII